MDHQVKVHRNHRANMVHQIREVDLADLVAVQVDTAVALNNHLLNMVHQAKVETVEVEALAADHHNHTVHLVKVIIFFLHIFFFIFVISIGRFRLARYIDKKKYRECESNSTQFPCFGWIVSSCD